MRSLRLLLSVLALAALVLLGCGDDDDADPTPPGIGDDDATATVPDDDSGAVGENVPDDRPIADGGDDEDSQTDTTATGEDDVVPESNRALVNGDFSDGDIELLLTENAACAIRGPDPAANESAAAEVTGATEAGDTFSLDWSTAEGTLTSAVMLDGVTWTNDTDLDDLEDPPVRLTRNGELLVETTYVSGDEETEALLYVNCQPAEGE